VDAEDIVRINSNLVTVPASVLDAQGRPVTDLKLEDFELRVDGQPKPISDLGSSETPVTLALLFDNSSSLAAAREFEKQAAIRFFRSVLRPATDLAAIYSISTLPVLEQPLTNDVKTLVRTIERFGKPEGATALFDAIVQAANYLRPYQNGRKVIIIVSDGADTISDINFDAALQRVQAADCQIYAVQTGHIENANLRDLAAERRLQDFAGQTGGAVYVPRGTGDLDSAFAQISADLAQQYVLSYYPTEERRDNLFRTISVRVVTRPNLRVRARRGYYPRKAEKFSGSSQPDVRARPGAPRN
jgi:Ca-activated chloride channel family protein